MDIRDSNGNLIDISNVEKPEQDLANQYIVSNDIVLELGARYGSVSCVINSKLNNKNNQVVVEPDERVWEALERNKQVNNCEFNIVKGFISKKNLGLAHLDREYGTTCVEQSNSSIPSYTLEEISEKYNLQFNVLVADCEGFLECFFDENPTFFDTLRLIIFEADYPEKCNYDKIRNILKSKGFLEKLNGHQNVWIKLTPRMLFLVQQRELKRKSIISAINLLNQKKTNGVSKIKMVIK
jgi:FkbM family methyltransferase